MIIRLPGQIIYVLMSLKVVDTKKRQFASLTDGRRVLVLILVKVFDGLLECMKEFGRAAASKSVAPVRKIRK